MKGRPSLVNGQTVLGTIDMSTVSVIAISLAVLFGLSFLLNLLQSSIMATVTQRISNGCVRISRKRSTACAEVLDSQATVTCSAT